MEKRLYELSQAQMRINRMRHRIIDAHVRKLGIHPSQHILLMQLSELGCFSSQAQIAERLDVSPASVARTIKGLEASGYIQRRDSDVDGRRNEIDITEKGKQVVAASREIFWQLERAGFDGFSEEELGQFGGMLDRILNNLCRLEGGRCARTRANENKEEMKTT